MKIHISRTELTRLVREEKKLHAEGGAVEVEALDNGQNAYDNLWEVYKYYVESDDYEGDSIGDFLAFIDKTWISKQDFSFMG